MTELMRWRMFGYMLALFTAGAISGAAVMSHMRSAQSLKVGRSAEIAGIIRQKLVTSLDLTPEQRRKFDPIINQASEEMEASHLECLKQVTAASTRMHAQMLPDLTPEQREKLSKLEAERREIMRQKYNYPPEGGGKDKAGSP